MKMTEICEYLTTNEKEIERHFGGMSMQEATDYLEDLFPGDDDNKKLAENIVVALA